MGKCASKSTCKKLKFHDPTTKNDEILSGKEIINSPSITIKDFLRQTIKNHYLFQCLTNEDLDFMISKLKFLLVPENQPITKEGTPGNFCYIINSGRAEVTTEGTSKGTLKRGDIFGENEIVQCIPRVSTITTSEKCTLWYLSKNLIDHILKLILNENKESIRELIEGVHIFSSLSVDVKKKIINHVVIETYSDSQLITTKGSKAKSVYLIKSGLVTINIRGRNKGHLYPGQVFGEAALLVDDYVRSANIIAYGKVQLISLYIDHIKDSVGPNYKQIFIENIIINVISIDPMARNLTKEEVKKLAKHFKIKEVNKEEVAIPEGREPNNYCYVICLGKIASDENAFVTYQFIGFDNANSKKLSMTRYMAESETIIAEITAEKIQEVLGVPFEELTTKFHTLNIMASTPLFCDTRFKSLPMLYSGIVREVFKANKPIFLAGDSANNLFIITKGSVGLFSHDTLIAILEQGSVLGETCLVHPYRLVTAQSRTDIECLSILKESVMQITSPKLELKLQKQKTFESALKTDELLIVSEQKMLNYRKSYIVHSAEQLKNYLVEIISKSSVNDAMDFSQLQNQKACLLRINYAQIPRMIRTFMDPESVYFVHDYFPFAYLSDCDYSTFTESCARFIILSINNILNALGPLSILHRNICPDNILIDETGYVHLHGFRYAKIVKDRTYTEVGNPIYRSKEMYKNTGYDGTSQYWSLGVILYELLTNSLPFEIEKVELSTQNIYSKIATKKLNIPKKVNPIAAEVIRGLLNDNPKERFGSEQLKACEWVQTCNFHEIETRKVKSPLKVAVNTYPIPSSGRMITYQAKIGIPERNEGYPNKKNSVKQMNWGQLIDGDFNEF